jgi:hypothetical protein
MLKNELININMYLIEYLLQIIVDSYHTQIQCDKMSGRFKLNELIQSLEYASS